MTGKEFATGDVRSQEPGSAARDNAGKPDYSLLPLDQVAFLAANRGAVESMSFDVTVSDVLYYLAAVQATASETDADRLLIAAAGFCWRQVQAENLFSALVPVVRVLEHGLKKYASWNWAKGANWSVPIACLVRHLAAIEAGEMVDRVEDGGSGQDHAAHVAANAFILAHYIRQQLPTNDLPVQWFNVEPWGIEADDGVDIDALAREAAFERAAREDGYMTPEQIAKANADATAAELIRAQL